MMGGCLPFLLPFEFQSVNTPPYIDESVPALGADGTGEALVTSLGLTMFAVVRDDEDLSQIDISWRVQNANGSRGQVIDSAIQIPNGNGTSITSQLSLDMGTLVPYDGGTLRLVIEDAAGETATGTWLLTVQEAAQ